MKNIRLAIVSLFFSGPIIACQYGTINSNELSSPVNTTVLPIAQQNLIESTSEGQIIQYTDSYHSEQHPSIDIETGLRDLSAKMDYSQKQSKHQYSKLKQKIDHLEQETKRAYRRQCCLYTVLYFFIGGLKLL